MGGQGSGRKSGKIERTAIKLEARAVEEALKLINSDDPKDKLARQELIKAIAPKAVSQIREKKDDTGRRNIVITFVERPTMQAPRSPEVIDITPPQCPQLSVNASQTDAIPEGISTQPEEKSKEALPLEAGPQ